MIISNRNWGKNAFQISHRMPRRQITAAPSIGSYTAEHCLRTHTNDRSMMMNFVSSTNELELIQQCDNSVCSSTIITNQFEWHRIHLSRGALSASFGQNRRTLNFGKIETADIAYRPQTLHYLSPLNYVCSLNLWNRWKLIIIFISHFNTTISIHIANKNQNLINKQARIEKDGSPRIQNNDPLG